MATNAALNKRVQELEKQIQQLLQTGISMPTRAPAPAVRELPQDPKFTGLRFSRHIDKFGPGDKVPEGVYTKDELQKMRAVGTVGPFTDQEIQERQKAGTDK